MQDPQNIVPNDRILEAWEYSNVAPYYVITYYQRLKSLSASAQGIVNEITPDGKSIHRTYTASFLNSVPTTSEYTQYSYDSTGNITSVIQDGVETKRYNYSYVNVNLNTPLDSVIETITITTPNVSNITDGNGNGVSTYNLVETYKYNFLGQLVSVTDAKGNETTHEYDWFGREIETNYPNGGIAAIEYDDEDNVIKVTDVLGEQSKYTFDAIGRAIGEYIYTSNAWRLLSENAYDNRSRLTQYITFNDNGTPKAKAVYANYQDGAIKSKNIYNAGTNAILKKTEYTNTPYYSNTQGNRTAKVYSSSNTFATLNRYNSVDNSFGTSYKDEIVADGKTVFQTYGINALDKIVSTKGYKANATGNAAKTSYIYDYAGRVQSVITPAGTTSNTYDTFGRLATETDGNGNITTYTYNNAGWVIQVSRPIETGFNAVTKYFYDKNGNVTREEVKSNAQGAADSWNIARNVYDNMNNITAVIASSNGSNEEVTKYTRDLAGKVTQMATGMTSLSQPPNASSHFIVNYVYNTLGQLISETYAQNNSAETYTYDLAGNMLTKTNRDGITTTYTYDVLNRLISTQAGSGQSAENISYTYNMIDNITSMTDSKGTTTYTYNARGFLTNETRAKNNGTSYSATYTYDADGNRYQYSVSGIAALSSTYTFDYANRLTKIVANNDTTSYTYDNNSNLLTEITKNSSNAVMKSATYTYNGLNLVKTQDNKAKTTTIDTFARTYYANGNVASETNNGITKNYTYDKKSRLTGDTAKTYTYDNRDNRVEVGVPGAPYMTQTQTYNPLNRLTKKDLTINYSNSLQGNRLSKTPSSVYTYDALNRLKSSDSVNYTYDGKGMLESRAQSGSTINYVNDGMNIVAGTKNSQTTAYVRGLRLIELVSGSTKLYYHHNPHGDVIKLTDANGNVVESYQYDSFGVMTTSNGSNTADNLNIFRYCGEYFDTSSTFLYLRARWYDPSTGTFISEDPIKDNLNWYAYCANNPLNFRDPWGLKGTSLSELSEAFGGGAAWDSTKGNATAWVDGSVLLVYKVTNGLVYDSRGNQVGYIENGRIMVEPTDFIRNYGIDVGSGTSKNATQQQAINYITIKAIENGMPVKIALATAVTENAILTQFNPDGSVVVNAGDYGIMQINRTWHPEAFNGYNKYNGANGVDIINNWHDNVDYGLGYLGNQYREAINFGYVGDDLAKATYSNYNSNSCSAYQNPNHDAYGHTNNFWYNYTTQFWKRYMR